MENPVSRDAQLAAEMLTTFIGEVPQPLGNYIIKLVRDEEYSESFLPLYFNKRDGFLEQWKRENRERITNMYNERYFEAITDPFLYEFKGGEKTTNVWDNTICKYVITEIRRLASSFSLAKAYMRGYVGKQEYPPLTRDLTNLAFKLNHAYIVADEADDIRPWYQIAIEAAGL